MPPQRTIPPAKAVKTERTHEENQERAYIAASRRSDRSLEARVESARRASEIHKRRTGRSLRVTEQDVVNEEMYEEEDDDLPLQYRRLTQHLQTGSADFNKRLSAYLTQHVAMRSALEQGIAQSYAQQYPNGPQFQGQYGMYQSPMLAHQQHQQQMMQQQQLFGQQPYSSGPSQDQQTPSGFRPHAHQRSSSIATPQELTGNSQPITSPVVTNTDRRMSMPVNSTSTISSPNTSAQQLLSPQSKSSTPPTLKRPAVPSFPQGSFNNNNNNNNNNNSFALPQYQNGAFGSTDFLGFSTALAPESQGLLGGGGFVNPSDPLTKMFMQGSNITAVPQYDFNTNGTMSPQPSITMNKSGANHQGQLYPSFDGLNSTLAQAQGVEQSASDSAAGNASFGHQSFFDAEINESNGGTGENTPGGGGEAWSLFMNDDKWDMAASQ